MANPQKENGFTPIANELVSQFAKTYMSSRESQIIWAVIRKTYGYQKKTDRISFSQLELLTGINRRHIGPALKRLIERRMLTKHTGGKSVSYGIQEDYELWDKPLPKPVIVNSITETGNGLLPDPVTKSLPISVNTKERKKYLNKGNDDFSLPDELKEVIGFIKIWNSWVVHRKEIKKPLTPTAVKIQLNKLITFKNKGLDIIEIIETAIEKGWQGFYELRKNDYFNDKQFFMDTRDKNLVWDLDNNRVIVR